MKRITSLLFATVVCTMVQAQYEIIPLPSSINIDATYSDGTLTISGAEGCTVRVYDLLGREMAYSQRAGRTLALRLPQAESYVVAVTTTDGQTVVRKITGR